MGILSSEYASIYFENKTCCTSKFLCMLNRILMYLGLPVSGRFFTNKFSWLQRCPNNIAKNTIYVIVLVPEMHMSSKLLFGLWF